MFLKFQIMKRWFCFSFVFMNFEILTFWNVEFCNFKLLKLCNLLLFCFVLVCLLIDAVCFILNVWHVYFWNYEFWFSQQKKMTFWCLTCWFFKTCFLCSLCYEHLKIKIMKHVKMLKHWNVEFLLSFCIWQPHDNPMTTSNL